MKRSISLLALAAAIALVASGSRRSRSDVYASDSCNYWDGRIGVWYTPSISWQSPPNVWAAWAYDPEGYQGWNFDRYFQTNTHICGTVDANFLHWRVVPTLYGGVPDQTWVYDTGDDWEDWHLGGEYNALVRSCNTEYDSSKCNSDPRSNPLGEWTNVTSVSGHNCTISELYTPACRQFSMTDSGADNWAIILYCPNCS